jgi:photosystem II stability/assembly factor-like uncharacterized protein/Ca2+-binding EF-hand superfamily protein
MLKTNPLQLVLLPVFSLTLLFEVAAQWESIPLPGNHPEVFALAIHGEKGLVIGTGGLPNSQTEATGILWSADRGASVESRSEGVETTRFDQLFRSVQSSDELLMAASADGVYFSENDGARWEKRSNGLPVIPQTGKKSANALTSFGSSIFCGTPSGVFKTSDKGKNWIDSSVGLTNLDVRALATLDNLIFASTDGDGVYCSSDDGKTWAAANKGMPLGSRSRALLAHQGALFAGTPFGTFRSIDKGESWTAALATANARSFAAGENIVALGAFRGSGSVYISGDNGDHWKDVSANLPRGGIGVWAMAMDDKNLYAAVSRHGMWRLPLKELKKIKTNTSPPQSSSAGISQVNSSNPLMLALDQDQDGEISAEEIKNATINLQPLDKNRDGMISESEFSRSETPLQVGGNAMFGRAILRLRQLDENGDGMVTRDEIPIGMQRILDRADSNGDDALDMQEIESIGPNLGRSRPD